MNDEVYTRAQERVSTLATKLDELVVYCDRLKAENESLRSQQQTLSAERARLIEKNEQARNRVEAMIARLKTLENL